MSFPTYPAYIDAGVDWLGKIPEHWQQKWLGLLAVESRTAFVDGPFGSDLKSSDYQEEGVPLIQLNNIRDGQHVLRNMKFINEEKRNELARHSAFPGDIVIAKMADPVARSAIVSDEFAEYVIVADCVKMSPDLASIDLSFLIWAINSDCVRISAELMSSGVTRIRINLGQIKKLKIPYPPICEQTQIARFLDHETARIDALIEEQQRLIELLKEKRQAVISHAVTKGLDPTVPIKDSGVEWLGEVPAHWHVKKLKNVTRQIIDGAHFTPTYVDVGIPFVRVTDIQTQDLDLDSIKRIPKGEHYELIKRCNPEKGDVLLSKNGTIGITKIVDWDFEFSIFVSLCLIKPAQNITSKYLLNVLSGNYAIEQFKDSGQKTSVTNLHLEKIREIFIVLPSDAEQLSISTFIDQKTAELDLLISEAVLGNSFLKERRSALISAAVTGKIDVRGWQPPASAPSPELVQEAV